MTILNQVIDGYTLPSIRNTKECKYHTLVYEKGMKLFTKSAVSVEWDPDELFA